MAIRSTVSRLISDATNYGSDTISAVSDSISSARTAYNAEVEAREATAAANASLQFPLSYPEQLVPIVFSTIDLPEEISVTFPCPAGVSFEDSANYDQRDIGHIGNMVLNTVNANKDRDFSSLDKTKDALQGVTTNVVKDLVKSSQAAINIHGITGIAGSMIGTTLLKDTSDGVLGNIKQGAAIAIGATERQYGHAVFTAMGARGYSFEFKFVATSEKEAAMLASISRALRVALYPETLFGKLIKFPPQWQITLSDNAHKHVPRFAPCYMTSFGSSNNDSGQAWYEDGAPVETTFKLAFTEVKTLTQDDIKQLHSPPIATGAGADAAT